VDQYHRMKELGILTEDDQVELIEGFLVRRIPETPEHDRVLRNTAKVLTAVLARAFGDQGTKRGHRDD
jgi:hypothetical protein